MRVPFLYSTNGEVIWFRDARHPLNRSRRLAQFYTPAGLRELLDRDFDGACAELAGLPNEHPRLRAYQRMANAAIEQAIAARKRQMLVAMATGTGKTFTLVNQVYRLMKSGVARRILFLVDRRALAAQAVRAFASFEPEQGLKFDRIYEVYSQRFRQGDLEDDAFDPNVLPTNYLTHPQPGHAFVYVCTIQRMATYLLGPQAVLGGEDDEIEETAPQLPIPIRAFDLVIADECHRGRASPVWARSCRAPSWPPCPNWAPSAPSRSHPWWASHPMRAIAVRSAAAAPSGGPGRGEAGPLHGRSGCCTAQPAHPHLLSPAARPWQGKETRTRGVHA
jgi:type I restriction enzyme R subunit